MTDYLKIFQIIYENGITSSDIDVVTSANWFLKCIVKAEEKTYNEYFNKVAEAIRKCSVATGLSINEIEHAIYVDSIDTKTEAAKIEMINCVILKLNTIRNASIKLNEISED